MPASWRRAPPRARKVPDTRADWRARLLRRVADPAFQSWAARFPVTRPFVRRDGARIFDLVSGFAQSQALRALVELRVLERLTDTPRTAADLARDLSLPPDRADLLLRAGVAMGLLSLRRGGFRTTIRGAALTGVPGLAEMIRHHDVLYRDLSDPVAFLKGDTAPELARFWPYVFGGNAPPDEAARYSRLMAESQSIVAEDTLAAVDLSDVSHLMDVGGGTGAFLSHALAAHPHLRATLVDLPAVLDAVSPDLAARIARAPRNFREDSLPTGADALSLVRVLYDHADDTVGALLKRCHAALPDGGRIVVSEPMTGGGSPHRPGDVYFAFYCAAMGTGRARSAGRIAELLTGAGFRDIRMPRPLRTFVTSVVTARR